jgi:hypothetical protein
MLVLLDENLPHSLRLLIRGHDVRTVEYQGWKSFTNGDLLRVAEEAGFNVLLTADQSIQYQQNIQSRAIAIVILSSNEREIMAAHLADIVAAIESAKAGCFVTVNLGT